MHTQYHQREFLCLIYTQVHAIHETMNVCIYTSTYMIRWMYAYTILSTYSYMHKFMLNTIRESFFLSYIRTQVHAWWYECIHVRYHEYIHVCIKTWIYACMHKYILTESFFICTYTSTYMMPWMYPCTLPWIYPRMHEYIIYACMHKNTLNTIRESFVVDIQENIHDAMNVSIYDIVNISMYA